MSMFLQNLKLYFLKLSSASSDELTTEKIRKAIQQQCPEVSREMMRFLSVGNIKVIYDYMIIGVKELIK